MNSEGRYSIIVTIENYNAYVYSSLWLSYTNDVSNQSCMIVRVNDSVTFGVKINAVHQSNETDWEGTGKLATKRQIEILITSESRLRYGKMNPSSVFRCSAFQQTQTSVSDFFSADGQRG
jgi:hypothetical protein